MTTPQRITLMADWWPKACTAQGWDKNDRAKRLEVLGQAVGRKLISASQLDNRADVDAVKNHLLMLADNVAATVETDHPQIGRARRLRFTIREQVQCLAIYMGKDDFHSVPNIEAAEDYLAELIRDKFQHGARAEGPVVRPLTIDDLTADLRPTKKKKKGSPDWQSDLDQLVLSLDRVLKGHRQDRGHSIHDMRTAAGLKCSCAQCSKRRRTVSVPVAIPVPVADLAPAAGPPWSYDPPESNEPF